MNDLTQIRTNLAARLRAVTGVRSMSEYPPESIDVNNAGWLGFATEEIVPGNRELGMISIDFFFVVNRDASLEEEIKTTEEMIPLFKATLRAQQGLGMAQFVNRVQVLNVRQAMIEAGGDEKYVGFVMALLIKTHQNVGSQYGP